MSYDRNGLGFAEMTQVAIYFPTVFDTVLMLLEKNQSLALRIARQTIDAYNNNMIEKEA